MFPSVILHFDIGRKKSILAVKEAMNSNQLIFLATQKRMKDENPDKSQIYNFGILANIKQIISQNGESMKILVERSEEHTSELQSLV